MNNKILKATSVLLLFSILTKICGFIRELVMAYYLGTSFVADSYITATGMIATIFSTITMAVGVAFLPALVKSKTEGKDISILTSNILNIVSLMIFGLSIVVCFFSQGIVQLFAIGFKGQALDTTVSIARIILPAYFLYTWKILSNSYLQGEGIFFYNGATTLAANIIIMGSFALWRGNTYILGLGYVFSLALPAIWGIYLIKRKGFRYTRQIAWREDSNREIFKMAIPVFWGELVVQLNALVDRNFASLLGEGMISSFQYANKLSIFFLTFFVVSIATAAFPTLAEQSVDNGLHSFKRTAAKANNYILLLAVPISAAMAILAKPIIKLVFERGAFDAAATETTALVLAAYSLGIVGQSLSEIPNRQFYALGDSKSAVVCNIIGIITNIMLNLIFIKPLGYIGLALATSVANNIRCAALLYSLHRKIGHIGAKHLLGNLAKMIAASGLMAAIVLILNRSLDLVLPAGNMGILLLLLIDGAVGAGIYFAALKVFKVEELAEAELIVKSYLKKLVGKQTA